MKAAGAKYEQLVDAPNQAKAKLSASLEKVDANPTPGTVQGFVRACESLRDTEQKFAQELVAGKWPEAAQEPVQALITAASAEVTHARSCSSLTSVDEIASWLEAAMPKFEDSGVKAHTLRLTLGLPPTEDTAP